MSCCWVPRKALGLCNKPLENPLSQQGEGLGLEEWKAQAPTVSVAVRNISYLESAFLYFSQRSTGQKAGAGQLVCLGVKVDALH